MQWRYAVGPTVNEPTLFSGNVGDWSKPYKMKPNSQCAACPSNCMSSGPYKGLCGEYKVICQYLKNMCCNKKAQLEKKKALLATTTYK